MSGGLAGKVAIVTGASSGIGRAIALRLAQDAAAVVVNYRTRAQQAEEVVAAIQAKGGTAVAIQADMSHAGDARRLITETVTRFGRLDILVNNAGKFTPKPFLETTEADFDALIGLHAKGPYFAMQEAAKVLSEHGRIVNITTATSPPPARSCIFMVPVRIWAASGRWSNSPRASPRNWLREGLPSTRCRPALPTPES